MQGLAPKTLAVFDRVSALKAIQDYLLVGGTGIALQIAHRLSEDLDFCRWKPKSNVKQAIPVKDIEKELLENFMKVQKNHLSFDQVDFRIEGVKLTFFNEVGLNPPDIKPISFKESIYGVPLSLHGAMKVKTMFERITYRDYYDIYALLKGEHINLKDLILESIRYQPKLKKDMVIKRLSDWELVKEEPYFAHLSPKYTIDVEEIGSLFLEKMSYKLYD